MREKREKGPVEILCDEIGFRFDRSMERRDIFISFVGVLIDEIADIRDWKVQLAKFGCEAPSDESGPILAAARTMLVADDKIAAAAKVHELTRQPDDGPCDHLLDMLSSCASAIRFGLETPCHSRHAASASGHVWRFRYGITLHDEYTSNWKKDWTRVKLQNAIMRLVPSPAPAQ